MGGSLALLAVCFLVQGREWLRPYYHLLTDPRVVTGQDVMANLHGIITVTGAPRALELLVMLVLAGMAWFASRRLTSFEAALWVTLLGGFLVSVHGYVPDSAICLPSLVYFRRSTAPGVPELAFALLLPLPYVTLYMDRPWIIAALLMVMFLVVGVWSIRRPALVANW